MFNIFKKRHFILLATTCYLAAHIVQPSDGASNKGVQNNTDDADFTKKIGLLDGLRKDIVGELITGYNISMSEGAELITDCTIGPDYKVEDFSDNCLVIKYFNQTALNQMPHEDLVNLVSFCACELANMYELWEISFDTDTSTRRLATMVQKVTSAANRLLDSKSKNKEQQSPTKQPPDYLWTDFDVTVYQVSIYTATKDYFHQQMSNESMALSKELSLALENDKVWQMIWGVCYSIAQDPHNVYRYMENIGRASTPVFFNMLQMSDYIALVYEASKACKLPLMLKFNQYKIYAQQSTDKYLNPTGSGKLIDSSFDNSPKSNLVQPTNDLDLELSHASASLLKCSNWQQDDNEGESNAPGGFQNKIIITGDCALMLEETIPDSWIQQHSSPLDRSKAAIKCGCQFLQYNATWDKIMQDFNVKVMSKALTNFMNRNQLPDFDNTPIWSLYGWFESIMANFVKNRKATIKEVVKTVSGDQDPLEMKSKGDSNAALELVRRACNYIVFNYNKGSKEQLVLKSIKYLDNLQQVSQDPMFVFHLTLQDPNLFKLHALSKMCLPFVR